MTTQNDKHGYYRIEAVMAFARGTRAVADILIDESIEPMARIRQANAILMGLVVPMPKLVATEDCPDFARFIAAARLVAELTNNDRYEDEQVRIDIDFESPRMEIYINPSGEKIAYVSVNSCRCAVFTVWRNIYNHVIELARKALKTQ